MKMNVFISALCLFFCAGQALAQGTFVLRGKAVNVPENERKLELAVTHPYRNESYTVSIRPDGTFEQTLPVAGRLQDVYLYLGDAVTVFTFPGDTINWEFDYKDCPASIRAWGNTPERSRELELCKEMYDRFRRCQLNLSREGYFLSAGTCDSDTLLSRAVAYVKDKQQLIGQYKRKGVLPHEKYFYQSAYFSGLSPLIPDGIALEKASNVVRLYPEGMDITRPYRDANFDFFGCPEALSFAQAYIRKSVEDVCNLFNQNWKDMEGITSQTIDLVVPNKALRDWYQVSSRFAYFASGSMEKVKADGEQLMNTLTDPSAKAFLKRQMEAYVYPFQPGATARDMTLPTFDGDEVSLSFLRGKYVYMDIWAEGCGPCMMEFQKAQAFHDKYAAYADKLVCIFLCARGDKENCRKIVDKHKLWDKGIHLFADDAHQEEAAKYNQDLWPTYVLIGPDGKIVEYGTARPSELLRDGENILDRCLKADK